MWDSILDFLTFQSFITPSLLIIFYLIGAVFAPFVSWMSIVWLRKKYFSDIDINLSTKHKLLLYTSFILCFFCMEIFWRMMLEILIAYFDIHDALMEMKR